MVVIPLLGVKTRCTQKSMAEHYEIPTWLVFQNVPHILDETKEEDEEEEEEFVPSYSKQNTSHKDATISWDDVCSFLV